MTENSKLAFKLLGATSGPLPNDIQDFLWNIIVHIGRAWKIDCISSGEIASAFRECVRLKCVEAPSYLEEYRSGQLLMSKLIEQYDNEDIAFNKIFFDSLSINNEFQIQVEHFKKHVVDELISVVIISGGFQVFGAENHQGYIGGSRFRTKLPYRIFQP